MPTDNYGDEEYRCDDCGKTFCIDLSAYGHADYYGHTVRSAGDLDA